jgi:uncharacterized protein YndB with AHSA1/START domain
LGRAATVEDLMTVDDLAGSALLHVAQPQFHGADADTFPPLHRNGGFPVVQDRWERLVSQVYIPAPVDRVWAALTDPQQVAQWLGVCRGDWATVSGDAILDFEDGEFFLCRTVAADQPDGEAPGQLSYLWRWVGVGPATSVTWTVAPQPGGTETTITVTEEAYNPASDWRSWNGMGWPGILDQLKDFVRTGTPWRWPWRRMGPYVQTEVSGMTFEVWGLLTSVSACQFWLNRAAGSLTWDDSAEIILGDASGVATLEVRRHVEAYQEFPSYLPRLEFGLGRPGWPGQLSGHLWIEPAGLGRSLLQVFHSGWEMFGAVAPPLAERKILTDFWVGAFGRADMLCAKAFGRPPGAHAPIMTDGSRDERTPFNGQSRVDAGPHGWSR